MNIRSAIAAIVLFLAWPAVVRAQEPSSSAASESDEELIAAGVELRKQGQDAEALARFERAYALRPSPHAAAQIGLAHQALAQWIEAERSLIEALHAPDDWVTRHRAPLESSLAAVQAHLGWLRVDSNVAGAEVSVGGQVVGRAPLERPIRVVAGDVLLEVTAPGYDRIQRTVHVEAKTQRDEVLTFVAPQGPPPSSPGVGQERSSVVRPPPAAGAGQAAWITLGTAAGLLVVGAAGLVTREVEAEAYDDNAQCGDLPGQTRSQRCGTKRDIGQAAQVVGIAAFAGAGVAAVASGALFVAHPGSLPPSTNRIACGVAGLLVSCAGTF